MEIVAICSFRTFLKDNPSLCFAVITGCLRISKESIFTGTNNVVSDTITDSHLDEYRKSTKISLMITSILLRRISGVFFT